MGNENAQEVLLNSREVSIEEIKEARNSLNGILNKTSLIHSSIFSNECGNDIYIKPENLQATGAFKIRGAYVKISRLTDEEKQKGIIASSAGNHAQGVAYAAKQEGVDATIVMPKTTPLIKVNATKSYGAKVVLEGDCYDEAYTEAKRLQKKYGYTFIHPFDDMDVILGQGTIGLEILEELEDVDQILVPIGGGGLISGIALAVKKLKPSVKVIGVEPEGAKSMIESVKKNKVISLKNVKTIAEGVAVKTPGDLTFNIIKNYVDEIITVSDFHIMEALLLLIEKHKLIAENAGALPLAALKKLNSINKKTVCVISGGNIDVVTISSMINRGLVSRGRLFCFSVELPDTPGELLKISQILTKLNGNIIKLDHNQFKTLDRFMQVQLEVTVETNGQNHINQIISELKEGGYDINRIY